MHSISSPTHPTNNSLPTWGTPQLKQLISNFAKQRQLPRPLRVTDPHELISYHHNLIYILDQLSKMGEILKRDILKKSEQTLLAPVLTSLNQTQTFARDNWQILQLLRKPSIDQINQHLTIIYKDLSTITSTCATTLLKQITHHQLLPILQGIDYQLKIFNLRLSYLHLYRGTAHLLHQLNQQFPNETALAQLQQNLQYLKTNSTQQLCAAELRSLAAALHQLALDLFDLIKKSQPENINKPLLPGINHLIADCLVFDFQVQAIHDPVDESELMDHQPSKKRVNNARVIHRQAVPEVGDFLIEVSQEWNFNKIVNKLMQLLTPLKADQRLAVDNRQEIGESHQLPPRAQHDLCTLIAAYLICKNLATFKRELPTQLKQKLMQDYTLSWLNLCNFERLMHLVPVYKGQVKEKPITVLHYLTVQICQRYGLPHKLPAAPGLTKYLSHRNCEYIYFLMNQILQMAKFIQSSRPDYKRLSNRTKAMPAYYAIFKKTLNDQDNPKCSRLQQLNIINNELLLRFGKQAPLITYNNLKTISFNLNKNKQITAQK